MTTNLKSLNIIRLKIYLTYYEFFTFGLKILYHLVWDNIFYIRFLLVDGFIRKEKKMVKEEKADSIVIESTKIKGSQTKRFL